MMTPILASRSPFVEGAALRNPFIYACQDAVKKLAAAVHSIWMMIKEFGRCTFGGCFCPIPQIDQREIFQNLPDFKNNGLYADLDLFGKWFFDSPNLLRNAVQFHLGKMPEGERVGFIEKLDRMDGDAVRECYVTALKVLVFYRMFIMYFERPEYQNFNKAYLVPNAMPGFEHRNTFQDLVALNGSIYTHEIFVGEPLVPPPLTGDEKELFINLDAKDMIENTPKAQRATDRVKGYMRDLIRIADELAKPDHTLNNELHRLLQ